ncbi:MAG: dTMP kinase [Candidatus Kerfeldbacteria bacterium CG15_BIG_FIL_POST_REV_8_21_14_020_45_12]|uniref:Thymidylate kinase n=1 Tax=Candidatus Kerfeldbacteria bacterium CG15_BIG_FIL_POST_REV_8_21_14_020_45_12 TaxID=2014247 RepID=A0A2M7H4M8_9BACT|nr:MAG: dTMP kinase [Candidatus Kerfeldbacteria bacterium CG15_BIG_FIL_POST_REV_8_21_14_020_45_12]PJA93651.1 MAG: dTMP kinase [Candidatus Kerfeldbacteria bacterium CG_4_9_14_3_um_filter_45_8]
MNRGLFIVFEGGEGSGKSHHSRVIADRLSAAGHALTHTHEPGGTELGHQIRKIILAESDFLLNPRAELLLFLADRAQHVEQIIVPALAAGQIVICDRFSGSTIAYQIGARRLPDPQMIIKMDTYARGGLTPDLVIYLDIDPKVGLGRKKQGGQELNRLDHESLQFHQRVRESFLKQVDENESWISVSTDGPGDLNSDKILEVINSKLSL